LHVNDPAVRSKFHKLAGQIEAMSFAIRPLVTNLASRPRLIDADGHGPAIRAEHPFLNQLRLDMRAVHRFRRSGEAPGYNYVRLPFGLECHPAHRCLLFFAGRFTVASTASSRS